jgi:hypothetical protein
MPMCLSAIVLLRGPQRDDGIQRGKWQQAAICCITQIGKGVRIENTKIGQIVDTYPLDIPTASIRDSNPVIALSIWLNVAGGSSHRPKYGNWGRTQP